MVWSIPTKCQLVGLSKQYKPWVWYEVFPHSSFQSETARQSSVDGLSAWATAHARSPPSFRRANTPCCHSCRYLRNKHNSSLIFSRSINLTKHWCSQSHWKVGSLKSLLERVIKVWRTSPANFVLQNNAKILQDLYVKESKETMKETT